MKESARLSTKASDSSRKGLSDDDGWVFVAVAKIVCPVAARWASTFRSSFPRGLPFTFSTSRTHPAGSVTGLQTVKAGPLIGHCAPSLLPLSPPPLSSAVIPKQAVVSKRVVSASLIGS